MRTQCFGCRKVWGENPSFSQKFGSEEEFSHTLCPGCMKKAMTPIYRRRQRQEGNPDCFGKACGFCDRTDCRYREPCVFGVFSERLAFA